MQIESLVVLISTLGSLIGTFSGIVVSSKLTAYRLVQLEEKVNKHNNLVERMALAETNINILNSRVESMGDCVIPDKIHNIEGSLDLAHDRITKVKQVTESDHTEIGVIKEKLKHG